MIDWKQSAELNGCTIEWLKARFIRFPKSEKRIITVCDECGDSREVSFNACTDLCRTCSQNKPETRELKRSIALKQFSTIEGHLKCSNGIKRSQIDKPEMWERKSEKHSSDMCELWLNKPEIWYDRNETHSTYIKNLRSEQPGRWGTDKTRSVHERQRGGNDIVRHHYIYDHSDLTKNIIRMTRSMHTSLHNLFRKYGIEVPHINMGE